jgi:hypothetical protein
MATTRRSAASARARGRRALAPPAFFAVLLAALGALVPGVAVEVEAEAATSVDVDTDPDGAHVELGRDLSWGETGTSAPHQGGRGGGGGCRRRWVPAPGPILLRPSLGENNPRPGYLEPPPSPDAKPYFVYCDATYITTIWAVPAQFNGGNVAGALRSLAEQLVQDLPFPDAAIDVSPTERGLAGLESWFWVTGYDGTPLVATVSGFGTTVTVEARATAATWSFGDGAETAAGLGRPYPERSDVVHVYERRSPRNGYEVGVRFEFAARYRVDGGPWQSLPAVARDAQRTYVVDEIRAQLRPGYRGTDK